MALIDRLFHDDADPERHIANHSFASSMWFLAKGEVTRAQVVSAFAMTAGDETQLDELISHYQGLSVDAKQEFHADLESAGILAEEGLITKTKYKSFLGLT